VSSYQPVSQSIRIVSGDTIHAATDSDEKQVALNLTEHTIDAKDVIQDIIEERKEDTQSFLVEYPRTCLGEFTQLLSIVWDVVPRRPIREQDGAGQSFVEINCREVLLSDCIDVLVVQRRSSSDTRRPWNNRIASWPTPGQAPLPRETPGA